jgi:hypothetical protein
VIWNCTASSSAGAANAPMHLGTRPLSRFRDLQPRSQSAGLQPQHPTGSVHHRDSAFGSGDQ